MALTKLLGLLVANVDALQWGCMHTRALQWFLRPYQFQITSRSDILLQVQLEVRNIALEVRNLCWWTLRSNLSKGKQFHVNTEEHLIRDASLSGWGVLWRNTPVQGQWSRRESRLPINLLKLRAVHLALQDFGPNLTNYHVLVRTDNIAKKAHLNKQGGTRSPALHREAMLLLRWAFHSRGTCPGTGEHSSGLAEPLGHSSRRVVSTKKGICQDNRPFRIPSGGPLCEVRQSLSPQVFLKILPSTGRSHGCTDIGLSSRPSLCISTNSVDFQGDQKDPTARGQSDTSGPVMAMQTVVLHAPSSITGIPSSPATGPKHASPGAHLPSTPSQATSDCLTTERRRLLDLGLSQEVTTTLLASRKTSTIQIYNSTWKVFHSWCFCRHKDPIVCIP